MTSAARADVGIRNAIWASVVSGAMNGRMLWWQDGCDQFEKADLCRLYPDAAVAAAAFVRDVDWSGFAPVACDLSAGLKGAVIGNDKTCLGWFRDAGCEPPDWPVKPVSGQTETRTSAEGSWQIDYFLRRRRIPSPPAASSASVAGSGSVP